MNRTKERIQNIILFVMDAICVLIAYYLSGIIWLYMYKGFRINEVLKSLHNHIATVVIAYILMFIFYPETKSITGHGKLEEMKVVVKKNLLMSCFMAIWELLLKVQDDFPRGVYLCTFGIAIALMWLIHMLIKVILIRRNKTNNVIRMIMVTTEERAKKYIEIENHDEDWMRHLESFIIIDKDIVGNKIDGVPVVANKVQMLEYIKSQVADEIYINTGDEYRGEIKSIVYALEEMGVTVSLKLDVMEAYSDFDASLGTIGSSKVVTFAHRFYPYKKLAMKRLADICGGIVGIIIMAVAFVFVAPAIIIESKGPIFFRQKRVGKGGRYFYIYKFRSMYVDAENQKRELLPQNEMNGIMFKMENDPRVTKVGRFLRKTSIDELPQFINVVRGDMSLVGTRPPTVDEFKRYEGHHKRRLAMRPGITGMWQAYGRNTVNDFEEIVKMDVYYIDHWSLSLDIKILAQTIITVIKDGGK